MSLSLRGGGRNFREQAAAIRDFAEEGIEVLAEEDVI